MTTNSLSATLVATSVVLGVASYMVAITAPTGGTPLLLMWHAIAMTILGVGSLVAAVAAASTIFDAMEGD